MEIEVRTTKLTKSKINQMDYIGIPVNKNTEVLGWVNLGKQKYVIVKSNNLYYRAEFITKIEKEKIRVQFPLLSGDYEYHFLTNIRCTTFNRGAFDYSPVRDDEKNLELYHYLLSFKEKTEIAGQIYY